MTSPVRILLLEDNLYDRQLVEATLRKEGFVFQLLHVKTAEEFRRALEHAEYDLIISDFSLPSYSGVRALALCRELQPATPFIFVSGTIGEEQAIEGLKSGATDYVLKDRLDGLGQAVQRALRESRERAKHRVAEEQVRLQSSALQAAANGIIITDREGKILFANKAFCEMSGYAAEEVIGQTTRLLNSGKHSSHFFAGLWKTILAGHVWHGELTNRRKDGTFFQEEMTITPVSDADGTCSHFIAVKQDITKRKQLEEQLLQAQKMEAIGKLAGGVAHDFNNLLLVINGNMDLALRGEAALDESTRQCLEQATSAGDRAANLVRQLLFFSRKQVIQFQSFNLNDAIKNLSKMVDRIIGEDISVQCNYAETLPSVHADIGMIEQVLVNLIVNARDAMPEGGTLFLTTESVYLDAASAASQPEARPGEFACITVRDTGSGIAPEHLPRIFEPFFTTKEVGKGTGLGLATVYGIVKQHQGWIEVSSEMGQGTAFKLFLPANVSSGTMKSAVQPKTGLIGGHERILLVEDDADVRAFLRHILIGSGYQVWDASNGVEAMKVWEANALQFDLLLTDIVMPDGLNGKELAKILRRESPTLKVILMSGYSPDVTGCTQHESHYLQKPYSITMLTQTVRNCLDERPEKSAEAAREHVLRI